MGVSLWVSTIFALNNFANNNTKKFDNLEDMVPALKVEAKKLSIEDKEINIHYIWPEEKNRF